jgi:hypothetical protein
MGLLQIFMLNKALNPGRKHLELQESWHGSPVKGFLYTSIPERRLKS